MDFQALRGIRRWQGNHSYVPDKYQRQRPRYWERLSARFQALFPQVLRTNSFVRRFADVPRPQWYSCKAEAQGKALCLQTRFSQLLLQNTRKKMPHEHNVRSGHTMSCRFGKHLNLPILLRSILQELLYRNPPALF